MSSENNNNNFANGSNSNSSNEDSHYGNNNSPREAASLDNLATQDSMLLPDPDDVFPDLDQRYSASGEAESNPTEFVKPGKGKDVIGDSSYDNEMSQQYILGTLIVRVVAARDLEPVQKGGLAQMVFGGGTRSSNKARDRQGTANPYASVKFGNSTQRSSEVYDTLDPVWPRQETMFMDVALPLSEVCHPRFDDIDSASEGRASLSSSESSNGTSRSSEYKKPHSVLTVALFHTPEVGRVHKPSKGNFSGDSNDMFLGMASIDLQRLFTGRDHAFDGWLRLSGTETSRGSVRLVCEYEASDTPPRPGDYCRFTRYCNPRDLYPLQVGRQFRIAEVNGDNVLIEYTTPEGWICSFQAHRFMLICEERHHSTVEVAQDELASLAERLAHSPLVDSLTQTVERVAVDGLLNIGQEAINGGIFFFNRWFSGGVHTVLDDVSNATNWDGRYNPNVGERLDLPSMTPAESEAAANARASNGKVDSNDDDKAEAEALPNMPFCPITGEPMVDPVVAADGTSTICPLLFTHWVFSFFPRTLVFYRTYI